MSNKEIMHFIMTNVVMNAPRPTGNTFNFDVPNEIKEEVIELLKDCKQEDGFYKVGGNVWILI